MDVRGALFQGPSDPGIDQADDRRLARQVTQVLNIFLVFFEVLDFPDLTARRPLLARAVGIVGIECVENIALPGEMQGQAQIGRLLNRLDDVQIPGIGHGYAQLPILDRQRAQAGLAEEPRVDVGDRRWLPGKVAGVHDRRVVILGQEHEQVVL